MTLSVTYEQVSPDINLRSLLSSWLSVLSHRHCHVCLAVLIYGQKVETLAVELTSEVQNEKVIERHMMPITAEADHKIVVQCAAVTVTGHRSDATNSRFSLLAQRHVETE